MQNSPCIEVASAAVLAFPVLAQAHSNHSSAEGWSVGFAHPLLAWDHILALVAAGLWAGQLGARARWLLPLTFLGVMACGAALGRGGFAPPAVEPMILTSVLVFGLLIAGAIQLPVRSSMGIIALFAFFHGVAHGAEIPSSGGVMSYAVGFMAASAALQAIGLLIAHSSSRVSKGISRALGGACAAAGLALVIF